jgi:hypothetical protein
VDTIPREYYMVHRQVWEDAQYASGRVRFLCIACLERRLGRQLRPDDFTDCPLNEINRVHPDVSPLLRSRLSH